MSYSQVRMNLRGDAAHMMAPARACGRGILPLVGRGLNLRIPYQRSCTGLATQPNGNGLLLSPAFVGSPDPE